MTFRNTNFFFEGFKVFFFVFGVVLVNVVFHELVSKTSVVLLVCFLVYGLAGYGVSGIISSALLEKVVFFGANEFGVFCKKAPPLLLSEKILSFFE